ncbi:MAG TPA: anhydro-N-acetylmuramic acid kinase [bacterium]|nr:anhydro-N-acetylmuramic acid kinase [bacterium]
MKTHKVIGLMSGTSADGVDAALVDIGGQGAKTRVDLLAHTTYPLDASLRRDIIQSCQPHSGTVDRICQLNFRLGEAFAEAAIQVTQQAGLDMAEIDLIGSHGQTLFHVPMKDSARGFSTASTLQVGEPAVIAERTGRTVVADFRCRDMAAGGIGAPLAPYVHYLLFRDKGRSVAVHNLGGISNLTLLPKGGDLSKVIGFDTGPANLLIDRIVEEVSAGKEHFDLDGLRAARGKIQEEMLEGLLSHPFITTPPPKATGREDFGPGFAEKILISARGQGMEGDDLVATVTAFTAESILRNYRLFVLPHYDLDQIILAGGGAYNRTLVSMLSRGFDPIPVILSDALEFPAKALEAVIFAVLAHETLAGFAANLPGVTGASRPVRLGAIIPGENFRGLLSR